MGGGGATNCWKGERGGVSRYDKETKSSRRRVCVIDIAHNGDKTRKLEDKRFLQIWK